MTFCYVFNAEPDGIGIVADTRVSRITNFGEIDVFPEDHLKIYSPARRSAIAIAGKIKHLKEILHNVPAALYKQKESKLFDIFINSCREKFAEGCNNNLFSDQEPPRS